MTFGVPVPPPSPEQRLAAATLSVVLPYWLDRPALEALEIAHAAEACGYASLWIGEMMTFDAFALAAAIARETKSLRLTVGPLAVGVRTPASLALGIASVAMLGGRRADLALGASTPTVVSDWHGRPFEQPVARMREYAAALRPLLAGERSSFAGKHASSRGFRMAGDPSRATLTIAAFGEKMLELAAQVADRIVLNLVTPAQVARVKGAVAAAAESAGRNAPALAVWIPACVDPSPQAWEQIARQLVVYVAPPGYGEMFVEAGFGETVRLARSGAHPREVLAAMPRELAQAIGAIGDAAHVHERLAAYAVAGADEIGIVPVTADDVGGVRLLAVLAPV